jgi:hypothetical protein
METNLKLARNIISSFIVDVKKHPEFLETENGTVYCHRNFLVAQSLSSIDQLSKSL